jgi:phosphofructokinase-like protein
VHLGMLTGGGDAPGLNAVIRAVVYRAISGGHRVTGFLRGWKGVLEDDTRPLGVEDVRDIQKVGGTLLLSSRTNPLKRENGLQAIAVTLQKNGIDCLIAIGGEDTLGVASRLSAAGVRVLGVPKTIDNDLNATDFTFGFDTAINRVADALDDLETTARSHERIVVVEIMGRHAGWMALYGGIAGGAHVILIPEAPFDTNEICAILKRRWDEGRRWALVAVAEGAMDGSLAEHVMHAEARDAFGHVQLGTGVGIGPTLADAIEDRTGIETRHVVLGHLQRGGPPSAFDRVLGTRLGVRVVEMAERGLTGKMASLHGGEMTEVDLAEAVGTLRTVPLEQYEMARVFFG